jgi:hypothetical protein
MTAKEIPVGGQPMHIISLGAGVQSSTMALMAAVGEILPMPHAAIFADTQDEPASVYKWLDWLEPRLPFPVHRVTAGRLSEAATRIRVAKKGHGYLKPGLPVFYNEGDGFGSRQCTENFKLNPIHKELHRVRCGFGVNFTSRPKRRVIQWIGISLDEVTRMKTARKKWITNRWPLIDAEMTRHDCLRWMQSRGFPTPPRSACTYCPHHNNAEWRRIKHESTNEFQQAVEFEKRLQEAQSHTVIIATPFLHRSCVPLDKVDFSIDIERGQGILAGFNGECEGMCGV